MIGSQEIEKNFVKRNIIFSASHESRVQNAVAHPNPFRLTDCEYKFIDLPGVKSQKIRNHFKKSKNVFNRSIEFTLLVHTILFVFCFFLLMHRVMTDSRRCTALATPRLSRAISSTPRCESADQKITQPN